jgi:hypothetical protein
MSEMIPLHPDGGPKAIRVRRSDPATNSIRKEKQPIQPPEPTLGFAVFATSQAQVTGSAICPAWLIWDVVRKQKRAAKIMVLIMRSSMVRFAHFVKRKSKVQLHIKAAPKVFGRCGDSAPKRVYSHLAAHSV